MDVLMMNQFPKVLIICILVVYFGYRLSQNPDAIGRTMIVKLLLSALLGILALSTASPNYHPWWLYFLRTSLMNYSIVLAYLAIDQMLNNKPYQPILKHKLFLSITALSIVALILDYMRRAALNSTLPTMMNTAFFQTDWFSQIVFILDYGVPWYLGILTIFLYWRNLHRYLDLNYIVRRSVCMLGFLASIFCIGSFCLLMAGLNLASFLFSGHIGNSQINQICNTISLLTSSLLILGFTVPEFVLTRATRPLERYLTWRRQQQRALLAYLHEKMIQIVPGVHLPHNGLLEARILIEISDARQIIWSQTPRTKLITPREEAEYLFYLICNHRVFDTPGAYLPPKTRHRSILKHDLAVAKHLKRLSGEYGITLFLLNSSERLNHSGANSTIFSG